MLKKKLRRLSAMLMAGVMAVSMMGTAFADGTPTYDGEAVNNYEAENVYVLNYSNQNIEGYEEWDTKILYASRYRTDHSVTNPDGSVEWWASPACVMNMINPSLIDGREADYPYASIPVYCVDGPTDAITGTAYRRVNLEESTYFSDEIAARLRAVVADAFPFEKDMSVLTGKVNAWIDANDLSYEKIENLNEGEVISSVQSVIWVLANDGQFSSTVYYDDDSRYGNLTCVYDYTKYYETANTADNIEALVRYLMALEGKESDAELVSPASFSNTALDFVKEADGTYTAIVSATVSDAVGMDLIASAEGKAVKATIEDGKDSYVMQITGLSAKVAVELAIEGEQTGGDVYLFDPIGGREISQSMIGYDDSTLPVRASVTLEPDRELVIHKYTPATPSGDAADGTQVEISDTIYKPLGNVQFSIYKVCTMEQYLNGEAKLSKVPSADEIALYKTDANKVITLTTDANGYAAHNFGKDNDAIYMIVEEPSAAVTKPVDPFYLAVPMTNPTGDGWLYEINVYPKNDTEGEPTINKDVTKLDNNKDTFDFGEVYDYIIRTSIPADMAKATQYTITDELDSRLNYLGNVSVKVFNGEEIALDAATDYTASFKDNTLTVALTPAGCSAVAGKVSDSLLVTPEVRVYFQASIKSDAGNMGVEIPNDATLDYTNSIGLTFKVESDEVVVYTGGFNLLKVDGNDTTVALSGAHFTLYRPANVGETADTTLMINEASIPVIEVSDLVSNENGKASIEGIAYGNYYLVETKAPTGYNLLPDPVKVVVDKDSHEDSNAIQVLNFGGFELPSTGGIGTAVYTLMGSMTMAASGMYIFLKKRED